MDEFNPTIEQQRLVAPAISIIERLKTIIVLGFLIQVILNCFRIITAFDFPWQLAEGQFILHHGYPEQSVIQAYGDISPHFVNEYIAYEIVIAGINHVFGWIGLCLFFGSFTFLVYAPCLIMFIKAKGRFSLMAAFLFVIALEVIDWRMSARPELIADACYLAVGMSLLLYNEHAWNDLQTFCFGLIFCIWTNVHGTFLIGLGMVGLWYSQAFLFNWKRMGFWKDLKGIRPGLAALIGCIINPYGFHRFIQPFQLHGLLWGQGTSPEMWPIPPDQAWILLSGTLFGIIALTRRIQKQKTYWMIALLCILQYLSFTSNRYSIFIGLMLLIIIWNEVRNGQAPYQPKIFPLFSALGKVTFYFLLTLFYAEFIALLINAMTVNIHKQGRFMYPNTLVSINSSLDWLRLQPKPNYMLLSFISEGSLAQMPGYTGIHPMIDSGTHRYSDEVNKLYYYTVYDPHTLELVSSNLNVNAVILDPNTFCWAAVLNASPEWSLVQIMKDSQLYLRKNNHPMQQQKALFMQWEQHEKRVSSKSVTSEGVLRGLNLRPDEESLQMWESTQDIYWSFDPQVSYLKSWLGQVPVALVTVALSQLAGKIDNSSQGIHILLAIRLGQPQVAMEVAQKWKPFILDKGYQQWQEIRADAFISGGDNEAARRILKSLWPRPRYSWRWAKLCQQAYADQSSSEPEGACLLTDLGQRSDWKEDVITMLNQNILRLSAP